MKALSLVLGSQAATNVFQALDQDRDGKLSPEECTNNFAGPMLMAVQSMAVAAPFLNEIRAKDHEIAFLRAKILALGGDISDHVPLETPDVVQISQQEWEAFVMNRDAYPLQTLSENPCVRGAFCKIGQLLSKILATMLIKLTQIPMAEPHDPESFFVTLKRMSVECVTDVKTNLTPLFKVLPKGNKMVVIMDMIHSKMEIGDFDREIRDFASGLFKVLDQDNDGKISPTDVTVYTDLFFTPCPDDESARKKFMAIFDNLDLAKSGSLSQDEIASFVSNIVHLCACAMLLSLTIAEFSITMQADTEIKAMMDFYIQDCKINKFREVHGIKMLSL